MKLWDLDTGKQLRELRGPTTSPLRLNFSPSGKRLICASINDAVRIWEIEQLDAKLADPGAKMELKTGAASR